MTILLLLLLAVPVQSFSHDWGPAAAALDNASNNDDEAGIRDALTTLTALNATTLVPRERALVEYAIGYGERSLAFHPGDANVRKQHLVEARKHLEAALEIDDKNGELHALLGSVLGAMIGFERSRGAELGPLSSAEMSRALDLEPNNPRVLLLRGIGLLNTPEEWGGGLAAAEPHLRRAVQLFNSEPPQRPWPNWGRAEAHVWFGKWLEKSGKRDAAITEYEEALKLAPRSQYARAMLARIRNTKP
jgi:tetratricopeptide (TPR) repeat protein